MERERANLLMDHEQLEVGPEVGGRDRAESESGLVQVGRGGVPVKPPTNRSATATRVVLDGETLGQDGLTKAEAAT